MRWCVRRWWVQCGVCTPYGSMSMHYAYIAAESEALKLSRLSCASS